MIYLKLFITFIKIGFFSFGGGYAMIPLIEQEIDANGWLTAAEFVDIIAIAEMTPGPIAVNSATFVGYRAAGFFGGIAATAGVALPSLVLILIISRFFFKFQKHPVNSALFYGIRPVIAGLIIAASVFVAETALFKSSLSDEALNNLMRDPLSLINAGGVLVLIGTLVALIKYKLHPIPVILCSGAMGVVLFYII